MLTLKDIKRDKRKVVKGELKEIESKLHPNPVISGFEILHNHKGRYIYFSAWKNGQERKDRYVRVHRLEVLARNIEELKLEYLDFLTE